MISGFYNVIKPTGMSSSDVVVQVRGIAHRYFKEDMKVGHFGTLDPAGAGVLPIAVGRATRLFDYAQKERKIYRAGFSFGTETDTLDSYGVITKTCSLQPNLDDILAVLPQFVGKIVQVPPNYSSKSVDGKRAYDLARLGRSFELSGREVNIYDIRYVGLNRGSFVFDVECSGGTYIRSLVRDVAAALNTVAYMSFIIRLQSGIFSLSESVRIDDIAASPEKNLLPLSAFTDNLPRFTVAREFVDKVLCGTKIKFNDLPAEPMSVYVNGELLGIGINDNGLLRVATRLI